MICDGCSHDVNFSEFRLWVCPEKGGMLRYCKGCRYGTTSFPDVYFDNKPEINLADDPITGKPREFLSRGQKAAYLKEKGIREAGDRYHGAPYQFSQNQEKKRVDTKHEVQMALKKVREMGKYRRHQEYLKLMKENQDKNRTRYGTGR